MIGIAYLYHSDFLGKYEEDINTIEEDIGPSPQTAPKSSKEDPGSSKSYQEVPKEEDRDDEDMIGPPLPPGMTKDSKTSKEEDLIGPPLPPGTSRSKDEDDDEDDEDDEPEEVRSRFFFSFPYKLYVLLFYLSVNATI